MALSSQALASNTFKRSYQKFNSNGNGRFFPNKRLRTIDTNLPVQRDQRDYYSCSSDDESDYYSSDNDSVIINSAVRNRRLSMPNRRRASVHYVSKPIRRNSKCIGESIISKKINSLNSNNSNISKIISAATESNINSTGSANESLGNNESQNSSLPNSDVTARSRCFDYLVGAIDEAWARYCDTTSFAENEMYNNIDVCNDFPTTPVSATSSDYESDYKSDGTELTDYESEFEYTNKKVSQQPESIKIQNLKDRLIKAKNFLQDYVESNNTEDSISFWSRWDLIKYATIELVEDDDDDEVIEDTIEDLERGRCFYNNWRVEEFQITSEEIPKIMYNINECKDSESVCFVSSSIYKEEIFIEVIKK